jgi:nicotinate-nucleotide adenylyltransferase
MNIGVFGGTFSPPHKAHLIVAEHVLNSVLLDKIIFVPSYVSPHKGEGEEKLAKHRLAMIRLAVKGYRKFEVSDIEIRRKGTSFTYHTLEAFKRRWKNSALFLIIGMDNFLEFNTWRFPERIIQMATLLVMTRPSFDNPSDKSPFFHSAKFIPVPSIDISSSLIRERIKMNLPIKSLVPLEIEKYIVRHDLYR